MGGGARPDRGRSLAEPDENSEVKRQNLNCLPLSIYAVPSSCTEPESHQGGWGSSPPLQEGGGPAPPTAPPRRVEVESSFTGQ